jgi:predicted DNA-binding protein
MGLTIHIFCVYYVNCKARTRMQTRHNITLDEEISKELETVAEELGEKKSNIIEKALTVYFDLLDLKIAQKRLKALKAGRDRLVDAEDVWKRLGL